MRYAKRPKTNTPHSKLPRSLKVVGERHHFCPIHMAQYDAPTDLRTGLALSGCPYCKEDHEVYRLAARELNDRAEAEGRDRRTVTSAEILELAEQKAGRQVMVYRTRG